MRAARQPRFRVGANGFEIKLAGVAADQRSADRFFVGHRGLTAYGAPPALCPMRANPNWRLCFTDSTSLQPWPDSVFTFHIPTVRRCDARCTALL